MSKQSAKANTAATPAKGAPDDTSVKTSTGTVVAEANAGSSAPAGAAEGVTDATEGSKPEGVTTIEDGDKPKAADALGQTLYGSNVQPATLKFGEHDVPLGEVVAAAHQRSGLSVKEWNDLPDFVREKHIADTVDFGNAMAEAEEKKSRLKAGGYVVVWHVKTGGKTYEPGDKFPADLVEDGMLVPGGSVAKV